MYQPGTISYGCIKCKFAQENLFSLIKHQITEHPTPICTCPEHKAGNLLQELLNKFQQTIAEQTNQENEAPTIQQLRDSKLKYHDSLCSPYLCPFCLHIYHGPICFQHHIAERCFHQYTKVWKAYYRHRFKYSKQEQAYCLQGTPTKRPIIRECPYCNRIQDTLNHPSCESSCNEDYCPRKERYCGFMIVTRWLILVFGLTIRKKLLISQKLQLTNAITNNLLSPQITHLLENSQEITHEVSSFLGITDTLAAEHGYFYPE